MRKLAALRELLLPMAVAQQAVVTDPVEPRRQDVHQNSINQATLYINNPVLLELHESASTHAATRQSVDCNYSERFNNLRGYTTMRIRFYDRQDSENPENGTVVENAARLRSTLERGRDRPPLFVELIGDNGYKLLLGLGPDRCCAQFSSVDGSPPYFMAVAPDAENLEGELEFLIGNTASPVPKRYCLPCSIVLEIAAEFAQTGGRKPDVVWEEI